MELKKENRTLKLSGDSVKKIESLADKKNLSFDNAVNILIEFALNNLSDEDTSLLNI